MPKVGDFIVARGRLAITSEPYACGSYVEHDPVNDGVLYGYIWGVDASHTKRFILYFPMLDAYASNCDEATCFISLGPSNRIVRSWREDIPPYNRATIPTWIRDRGYDPVEVSGVESEQIAY